MSRLTEKLCQAVWDEIEPIIEHYPKTELYEAQLMAYFPALKLMSLLGSTFVKQGKSLNFLPYASSFILLEEDLPTEKNFYLFVRLRRPIANGIRIDYLLPYIEWNDEVRVEQIEIEVNSESGRERVISAEVRVPQFATEWLENYETF